MAVIQVAGGISLNLSNNEFVAFTRSYQAVIFTTLVLWFEL